jgi:nucleoside-diphosphate-sugar epimerase
VIHVQDAARAFIELAMAPLARIKTTNYIILGPTPSPMHEDLVTCVRAKIPSAKTDYQINEPVQKLIDSVTGKAYEDACARKEWEWKPQYNLAEMVDSFLNEQSA